LLATRKLPALIVPQVTLMIGNGVEKLVERAFAAVGAPLEGAALLQANRDMAPIYLRHVTEHTTLMPGVREALAVLHVGGVKLGVVTNKPQAATREILVHFGLLELLKAVVGGDAVVAKKPAPDGIFLALEKCGVGPAGALLVGDSLADVGAARAAGIPVVLIRGGYTQAPVEDLGADLVLNRIDELPAILRQPDAA
jgi:phosphoglycolate phosphatase